MKVRHPESLEIGLLINVKYPELQKGEVPQYRFMSVYESNIETNKDDNYQFLIISADPYENVGFKVPSKEIYRDETNDEHDNGNNDTNNNNNNNNDNNGNNDGKFWTFWDQDTKEFYIQFFYKGLS